jgi:hypothetical protein
LAVRIHEDERRRVAHPDIEEFWKRVTAAKTTAEMEKVGSVSAWTEPRKLHESGRIMAESCRRANLATLAACLGS